jgi:uncharacterized protein
MSKAVSDSTPLILLAKIGRLELLKTIFTNIYIPEAVNNEVVTQGKTLNQPDAYIIEKATKTWIHETPITPKINTEYSYLDTNTRLDEGEKQALKLCKQVNTPYFIADDKEARKVAKILNIKPIGTLGVTIQAIKIGDITQKEAENILNDHITMGLRIDTTLYKKILDIIESTPIDPK